MKQMIPKEANRVISKIRKITADYFTKANKKYAVLGVSGGLDSAVVAGIMSGIKSIKTIGGILPCGSNRLDEKLAKLVIKKYKLQEVNLDLGNAGAYISNILYDKLKYNQTIYNAPVDRKCRAQGNIKARLRMITLYHISQLVDGIVLGTDNYSEYLTGFWTICGDVGDFSPIQQLWKSTEVVALAKALGVPKEIIDRPPTDGLTPNGKDEDQLGLPYDKLDPILEIFNEFRERKFDFKQVCTKLSKNINESHKVIQGVIDRVSNSEFKRNHPKIITREDLEI